MAYFQESVEDLYASSNCDDEWPTQLSIGGYSYTPGLPNSVWIKIFEYLSASEILTCKQVCKRWNQLLSDNFQVTQVVIFLRDINKWTKSNEKFGRSRELHVVREETLGSHSKTMEIRHLTFRDIVERLKNNNISPTAAGPSSPSSSLIRSRYRKQVWIHTFNVDLSQYVIENLLNHLKHFITHLTVAQDYTDNMDGRVTTVQLANTLQILSDSLEYFELSFFPRRLNQNQAASTSTVTATTAENSRSKFDFVSDVASADFPLLEKLETLRLAKPYRWMNTPHASLIILELCVHAPNLKQIFNCPLIFNFNANIMKQLADKAPDGIFPGISNLKSLYLNAVDIHRLKKVSPALRRKEIEQQLQDFSTSPSAALTCLKIDPFYKSPSNINSFLELLRSSKDSLEELKIPPVGHLLEMPLDMTKLKKLTLFDDLFWHRSFFSPDAYPGLSFPNLSSVVLKLKIPAGSWNDRGNFSNRLDTYLPENCAVFPTVSRLKISCEMAEPSLCAQKLCQLFPSVTQLELKASASGNELEEIVPALYDLWPDLTHLTFTMSKFGSLSLVPAFFVYKTLLGLNDLQSMNIRFPTAAYGQIDAQRPEWIVQLGECLESGQLRGLKVYVNCGWKMPSIFVNAVRSYFEPWKATFIFNH